MNLTGWSTRWTRRASARSAASASSRLRRKRSSAVVLAAGSLVGVLVALGTIGFNAVLPNGPLPTVVLKSGSPGSSNPNGLAQVVTHPADAPSATGNGSTARSPGLVVVAPSQSVAIGPTDGTSPRTAAGTAPAPAPDTPAPAPAPTDSPTVPAPVDSPTVPTKDAAATSAEPANAPAPASGDSANDSAGSGN